jgi:hypothetical protein
VCETGGSVDEEKAVNSGGGRGTPGWWWARALEEFFRERGFR